MKIFILTILLSISVQASFDKRPPNFNLQNKRAVFVDFKTAEYNIEFDTKAQKARVLTTIKFLQKEAGYPLFDLVSDPYNATINGENVSQKTVQPPGNVTTMRMIEKELAPGLHTMTLSSFITSGTRFNTEREKWYSVSSAFFIRDLKDRKLLEKFLPTNMEYDQYKMTINVEVTGTKRYHSLFANGDVTKHSEFKYTAVFPEWYSSSSLYFHFVPINKFVRWYLKYPSIDGREIPVTIYSSYRFYNKFVKDKTWAVMKELEADYGPYPHDKLIIYGTGIRGGMEYAGATETSLVALGHELQHMYFAKCIHPANGNSGWLDEAIASWRDKGHQTHSQPFYHSANLAAQNVYTRKTDKRSYEYGRSFMSYLDFQLKEMGRSGLKEFLAIYFNKRKYTAVTTQDFKSDLEEYAQMSFDEDFFQYIYGGQSLPGEKLELKENPYHPNITEKDLDSIL